MDALQGRVDIQAVVAIAEARRPVQVRACGDSIEVPSESRERLWRFVQVFAHHAIEAGTWNAPGADASNAEADGEPGAEADATAP